MKSLSALIAQGGPTMIAIIVLSVILYTRCFHLLLGLWRSHADQNHQAAPEHFRALRRQQVTIHEGFRRQRIALGAMIAAAPLLGLLGTVSGMVTTFESLSTRGQSSMEELAGGISEVLVATESGLIVAIPALLLVCLAHHGLRQQMEHLNRRALLDQGKKDGAE
jgi:biopolymer transport protein ExbB/TolQ